MLVVDSPPPAPDLGVTGLSAESALLVWNIKDEQTIPISGYVVSYKTKDQVTLEQFSRIYTALRELEAYTSDSLDLLESKILSWTNNALKKVYNFHGYLLKFILVGLPITIQTPRK